MSLHRRLRLVAVVFVCLLGLTTLPASPALAQSCANIGPGAFLAGCDLSGMDLSGANLAGANLRGADLEGTNLDGANLSGANLSKATLTEGALDNANTTGANLRGIRWVPVVDPAVTLSFAPTDSNGFCFVQVGLVGFAPDTIYTVLFFYFETTPVPNLTRTITTDAGGAAFASLFSHGDIITALTAEVDGLRSATLPISC